MNYIARIKENQEVTLHTEDYFDKYPDLVIGWQVQELLEQEAIFIQNCKLPKLIDGVFVDAYVEVVIVPEEISRMKFELQLYITTTVRDENNNIVQLGKTFQDIIDFINSLQMSSFYKNLLIMRLMSCVTLERDNDDLNALAPGMGITQLQLDEIFINGNLIE